MQGSKELIGGLREIDPKQPYGTDLFDALARITVSVAVEAVCLRLSRFNLDEIDGTEYIRRVPEVYLIQRSPTDTAYPGEWHCPGSVLRPGEEDTDVFNRLVKKEFGGKLSSTRFVANVNHPTEARGHFFSLVYLCALEESDGLRGKWFRTDQLPEKTVESHCYRVIPAAVGAFVAENTKICR